MGLDNPFLRYSKTIHTWLINFWQAENFDAAYREILASVLSRLWISTTQENNYQDHKVSLLTLPALCCSALGQDSQIAIEVNAAWSLLYAAFYLLDKFEDQEADGDLFSPDPGIVINATTGFILSASLILAKIDTAQKIRPAALSALQTTFHQTALAVCAGQHLDLSQSAPDLKQVWHNVAAKSGEFFSLGCTLGAFIATNDLNKVDALAIYGRHLGILLQISNDIQGLWKKGTICGDLARGQFTLPVAYAFSVLPASRSNRLAQQLYITKDDPRAESEVRELILGCGALVYLLLEAERHRHIARIALSSLTSQTESIQALQSLLDQIGKVEDTGY